MKKIKKTGKQNKVVKKSKPTKKVVKAQKPKNKIKKQTVHTDEFHVNEKISRPRGRPKGKKNKKEAVEGVEKKISNVYFTPDTELAIVAYNETEDPREKDKIYNEKIQGAFGKIAENIYNTFKFSYADVSPLEIQKQAISHMVANMSKYEKGKSVKNQKETTQETLRVLADLLEHVETTQSKVQVKIYPSFLREVADEIDKLSKKKRKKK